MSLLALALALVSTPSSLYDGLVRYPRPATVNVSAVRELNCGAWTGSGFLIADGVLVTALHVGKGAECKDVATGGKLTLYREDAEHDLALMTGPTLPTNLPYIKTTCSRFSAGQPYLSYGVSNYDEPRSIVRTNIIFATDYMTTEIDKVDGKPSPNMRLFAKHIAPGMSGGPVIGLDGYARGLNNAGSPAYTLNYEFADTILCK